MDKIVLVDVYVTGCSRRVLKTSSTRCSNLQDKIDTMTLAKKAHPEVRLDPNMVENFKRQVMIAQTLQPK